MLERIVLNGSEIDVEVLKYDRLANQVIFKHLDQVFQFQLRSSHENALKVLSDATGKNHEVIFQEGHGVIGSNDFTIEKYRYDRSHSGADSAGSMVSPMPGKILKVNVKAGDHVDEGQPLIVMEAMKMEHTIKSNKAGLISSLNCSEGQLVEGGVTLVEIGEA